MSQQTPDSCEETSEPREGGEMVLEDSTKCRVTQYKDGTIRTDFKAEGLNMMEQKSVKPRGSGTVGEPFYPEYNPQRRTSHPKGWVRF